MRTIREPFRTAVRRIDRVQAHEAHDMDLSASTEFNESFEEAIDQLEDELTGYPAQERETSAGRLRRISRPFSREEIALQLDLTRPVEVDSRSIQKTLRQIRRRAASESLYFV